MSSLRAQRARSKRPQGVIVYEGKSQIDGEPIIVIATGFQRRSANPKTGNMLQTWILRRDINPFAAIHDGADTSICGDCPLRGIIERSRGKQRSVNRRRACYVSVHQAPLAVFQAYQRGRYELFDNGRHLGYAAAACSASVHTAIPAPRRMQPGRRLQRLQAGARATPISGASVDSGASGVL